MRLVWIPPARGRVQSEVTACIPDKTKRSPLTHHARGDARQLWERYLQRGELGRARSEAPKLADRPPTKEQATLRARRLTPHSTTHFYLTAARAGPRGPVARVGVGGGSRFLKQ